MICAKKRGFYPWKNYLSWTPYLTHFTACVQSCVQSRKGWDVILDQTAFYPEGGGQPYDLGTLGGTFVLGGPRAGRAM